MKLDARQRWMLLGGLLTATLAAAAWVSDQDALQEQPAQVAEAIERPRLAQRAGTTRSNTRYDSTPQVQLEKLDARGLGDATNDPFAPPRPKVIKQTAPKPAPVVVAVPAKQPRQVVATTPVPPRASAPPVPFTYMGKMISGTDHVVFLVHGNRNLVVREGDTIDGKYRVDQIGDAVMTVTYLPIGSTQEIRYKSGR